MGAALRSAALIQMSTPWCACVRAQGGLDVANEPYCGLRVSQGHRGGVLHVCACVLGTCVVCVRVCALP